VNINKKYNIFLVIIFFGSILLRLGLANYNREANDFHMPVVRYIMKNNTLPEKSDCPECFQPKLFHYTIAKILGFMRLDHIRDSDAQKVVAQLINFLVGISILVIAWIFVNKLSGLQTGAKILGFALLAFNPQLIGINSQVTNDTLLILFSSLAIFCAYFALAGGNLISFLFVVLFSVLAVITKTNGWVSVVAITITFFVRFSQSKIGLARNLFFAVSYPIFVVSLALLSPLSQYTQNYQRYGSPVTLNIDTQDPPLVFEKTYIHYAGILSIQDGFITFKFGNLLKAPVTPIRDKVSEESNRTSLWTRLYASANSVHFENYPPSWRITGQTTYWIYRGIFILALLPVAIMLIGAAMEIYGTIKGILTRNELLLNNVSYGLFSLLFVGHALFVILYAYEYRVYTVMKAIFTYPGLLALLVFFAKGSTLIFSRPQIKNQYVILAVILMIALLVFYILDVATLIFQLIPNQSGFNLIVDRLLRAWQ